MYTTRLPKNLFIVLIIGMLVSGVFFSREPVSAQALGGKILPTSNFGICPPAVDPLGRICSQFYYVVGPPRPTLPTGVLWPMGPMTAAIGRWFLGRAVGGIITIGGLGGF